MSTNTINIEKATYIPLKSKPETALQLEEFLRKGSSVVRQTEPGTPLWFGLKEKEHFAIFDLFYNETCRKLHFSGQVAKALKEKALELVQNGWENGVVQNINNFDLLTTNHFDKSKILTSKVANLIVFKVKPGKNREIELFLQKAAQIIDVTEPQTYFWVALKADADTYAIFDTFPDSDSQTIHFSGKVATLLKNNADKLIIGGWENGVIANIHNFEIIAFS
ncbi:hypothetical protein [Legionella longbeachae]|uniref:Antibiotic biosynthesis monooxygenase n=1 Tax=Legionella longbeachae serogroup 1 (strain NSW150) TaxID=661367 RepID=D3HL08_LEGLN|nr:hypothetical protein [Legionella longbeachae]VEE03635.1 Uncharacterised protein [Legionella oakridgensis]HBD7397559.1 hypothetical protein [Legionella pneumophila]ARB93480.1 hypothetical protein A6J40_15445 [Legionella longbeachae]ARM33415.1 hypothetical protein B0B39_07700 [Legionella longbeachae]EEZ93740.1 conserved hypothetical protein [Legionella longbeachae D-4968]